MDPSKLAVPLKCDETKDDSDGKENFDELLEDLWEVVEEVSSDDEVVEIIEQGRSSPNELGVRRTSRKSDSSSDNSLDSDQFNAILESSAAFLNVVEPKKSVDESSDDEHIEEIIEKLQQSPTACSKSSDWSSDGNIIDELLETDFSPTGAESKNETKINILESEVVIEKEECNDVAIDDTEIGFKAQQVSSEKYTDSNVIERSSDEEYVSVIESNDSVEAIEDIATSPATEDFKASEEADIPMEIEPAQVENEDGATNSTVASKELLGPEQMPQIQDSTKITKDTTIHKNEMSFTRGVSDTIDLPTQEVPSKTIEKGSSPPPEASKEVITLKQSFECALIIKEVVGGSATVSKEDLNSVASKGTTENKSVCNEIINADKLENLTVSCKILECALPLPSKANNNAVFQTELVQSSSPEQVISTLSLLAKRNMVSNDAITKTEKEVPSKQVLQPTSIKISNEIDGDSIGCANGKEQSLGIAMDELYVNNTETASLSMPEVLDSLDNSGGSSEPGYKDSVVSKPIASEDEMRVDQEIPNKLPNIVNVPNKETKSEDNFDLPSSSLDHEDTAVCKSFVSEDNIQMGQEISNKLCNINVQNKETKIEDNFDLPSSTDCESPMSIGMSLITCDSGTLPKYSSTEVDRLYTDCIKSLLDLLVKQVTIQAITSEDVTDAANSECIEVSVSEEAQKKDVSMSNNRKSFIGVVSLAYASDDSQEGNADGVPMEALDSNEQNDIATDDAIKKIVSEIRTSEDYGFSDNISIDSSSNLSLPCVASKDTLQPEEQEVRINMNQNCADSALVINTECESTNMGADNDNCPLEEGVDMTTETSFVISAISHSEIIENHISMTHEANSLKRSASKDEDEQPEIEAKRLNIDSSVILHSPEDMDICQTETQVLKVSTANDEISPSTMTLTKEKETEKEDQADSNGQLSQKSSIALAEGVKLLNMSTKVLCDIKRIIQNSHSCLESNDDSWDSDRSVSRNLQVEDIIQRLSSPKLAVLDTQSTPPPPASSGKLRPHSPDKLFQNVPFSLAPIATAKPDISEMMEIEIEEVVDVEETFISLGREELEKFFEEKVSQDFWGLHADTVESIKTQIQEEKAKLGNLSGEVSEKIKQLRDFSETQAIMFATFRYNPEIERRNVGVNVRSVAQPDMKDRFTLKAPFPQLSKVNLPPVTCVQKSIKPATSAMTMVSTAAAALTAPSSTWRPLHAYKNDTPITQMMSAPVPVVMPSPRKTLASNPIPVTHFGNTYTRPSILTRVPQTFPVQPATTSLLRKDPTSFVQRHAVVERVNTPKNVAQSGMQLPRVPGATLLPMPIMQLVPHNPGGNVTHRAIRTAPVNQLNQIPRYYILPPNGASPIRILTPVAVSTTQQMNSLQRLQCPPLRLPPTTTTTAFRQAIITNPVRPQVVASPSQPTLTIGTNQILLTPFSNKHPAPLPTPPKYSENPKLKTIPPKPSLSLSRKSDGINLTWNLNLQNNHSDIGKYELYAYQETKEPPNRALWKSIGDIKSLALPMACTLTQFNSGNRYHFAVRAVDVHGRYGEFSEPQSIRLPPENT